MTINWLFIGYVLGFYMAAWVLPAMGWRRLAPPPNDPLTLEQLLEMDGEPVYCVSDYMITVNGESCQMHDEAWGIVTGTDLGDQGFVVGTALIYYLGNYGKTWFAYRRKPEAAP